MTQAIKDVLADIGADVTEIVGSNPDTHERQLFDLFKAHFARAVVDPKVNNFRLCVEAYDEFIAVFSGGKN